MDKSQPGYVAFSPMGGTNQFNSSYNMPQFDYSNWSKNYNFDPNTNTTWSGSIPTGLGFKGGEGYGSGLGLYLDGGGEAAWNPIGNIQDTETGGWSPMNTISANYKGQGNLVDQFGKQDAWNELGYDENYLGFLKMFDPSATEYGALTGLQNYKAERPGNYEPTLGWYMRAGSDYLSNKTGKPVNLGQLFPNLESARLEAERVKGIDSGKMTWGDAWDTLGPLIMTAAAMYAGPAVAGAFGGGAGAGAGVGAAGADLAAAYGATGQGVGALTAGGTGAAAGAAAGGLGSMYDLGLLESAAGTTGFGSGESAAWALGDYGALATPSTGGMDWSFFDGTDFGNYGGGGYSDFQMPYNGTTTSGEWTSGYDLPMGNGPQTPTTWQQIQQGWNSIPSGMRNLMTRAGLSQIFGGGQGGQGGVRVPGINGGWFGGDGGMGGGTTGDLLGSALGFYSQQQTMNRLEDMMHQAQQQADPFSPNRGEAARMLMELYSNPMKSGGLIDQAIQPYKAEIEARDAKAGRNSQYGARSVELGQKALSMLPQLANPLMTMSGATANPNAVSQATQSFSMPIAQAGAGRYNAIGYGLNSLFPNTSTQQNNMYSALYQYLLQRALGAGA